MGIDYINDPKTPEIFGMKRYQKEIHERLQCRLNVIEYPQLKTKIKCIDIINYLAYRYLVYPFLIKLKTKKGNIKHITSQDLGYLLKLLKLKKTIVTCYDLIPWIYEKNRSFIWKHNMAGLKKADRIITISKFSKNEIIKYLGYPENRIYIIYPAVNHDHYYRKRDREILKKHDILENEKIILYVGSEMPRKNIPFLIKAFAKLKNMLPDIKLFKIGSPQWPGARKELLKLREKLKLQKDVIFIGYALEEELPRWYNAADLFIFPSFYEGFGLPPLEAMACGTPVITSNTSSLPEVVGDAGIMIDPYDVDGLAKVMYEVLTNDSLREDMIKKGLKRAKMFSWKESAEKILKVYKDMSE